MENQINKTNTMPPALEAIDLPASQKEELLVAYESIFLEKKLQIPADILGRVKETIALMEILATEKTDTKKTEIEETETVRPEIDEIINAIKIGIKGIEQSGTKEFTKRDADYYLNKYLVKADLEALAEDLSEKTGKPQTVLDLSAGNIKKLDIICTTGETVKGPTYLKHAAIALGWAKKNKKVSTADTLEKLKQIAGIEIRDAEYYQNKYLVKADLEAFAEALSKETGKPQTVLDLTASNIKFLNIVCTTGETFKGPTYLYNARKYLFKDDDKFSGKDVLKKLIQIAGIEIKEFAPRDAEYYQNKDLVKADLEAFAKDLSKKTGKSQTILDLSTRNIQKLEIICTTGEKVKGLTYLNNAGKYLLEDDEKFSIKDVLKKLIQIAEIESKNKIYSPDYSLFFTDQAQQNTQILVDAMLRTINQNLPPKAHLIFDENFPTSHNTTFTFKLGDKTYQTNFNSFIGSYF